MNHGTVDDRLQRVFKEALGADSISLNTTINDVDGWDSFGHVKLVLAIEETFGLKLEFGEMMELSSVEKIQRLLADKGVL